MSKYIGSSAVNLSTTSADVTGNADIDGNLTVGGNLTVSGTTITVDHATAQTVDLGDNDKIRLGADYELQLWSDGTTGQISGDINHTGSITTERLGLGTTSPIGLAHLSQAGGADTMLVFENTSGTNPFQVGQGNDDSLRFYYNASEKMRITSSGDAAFSGSSGTTGTIKGRGTITISDDHGDNTGGAVTLHYAGNGGYSETYIENNNTLVLNADPTQAGSNTSIKFRVDDDLKAMIDASGNLMIANTDTDPYDNSSSSGGGIALRETGAIYNAVYQGTPVVSNRIGNDGDILQVRNGGVKLGAVGNYGTNVYFAQASKGVGVSSGRIYPSTQNGTVADNSMDLGNSDARWLDLYLSGGVYLGGTVTGNKLDDYEIGNFAPVYAISGGSVTTGSNAGRYVKVGDFVFFTFRLRTTAVSGTGALSMTLPFTSSSENRSGGSRGYARDWGVDMPEFTIYTPPSSSVALFYRHAMNVSTALSVTGSQMGTGGDDNVLEGSIVYRSA